MFCEYDRIEKKEKEKEEMSRLGDVLRPPVLKRQLGIVPLPIEPGFLKEGCLPDFNF